MMRLTPRRSRVLVVALPVILLLTACVSGPTPPRPFAPGQDTAAAAAPANPVQAQDTTPAPAPVEVDAEYVREHYTKREVYVPMRDGTRLFTSIYTPRDTTRSYPILLFRTPYSVAPYGPDAYPGSLGPSGAYVRDGFIFVYQDVRGRMMSEGTFANMTPHVADKQGPEDTDESSDTYDTIEWLLAHVQGHNGRVGQWGISYPGFYSAVGMIDAHPALKAVSPQAPIADWWYDDFHHNGAFFLPHFFGFFWFFGQPRPEPTTEWPDRLEYGSVDGYAFYRELGPLGNINDDWYRHRVAFWDSVVAHPDYDAFWQRRNILPHLRDVAPAVLVVGGWYDAEDLYGPLAIYRAIESQDPGSDTKIIEGPWVHGGWSRTAGDRLGDAWFGGPTSRFYRDSVELPWFRHHLKGGPDPELAEATMFDTGRNEWRRFDRWTPAAAEERSLYLGANGRLTWRSPADRDGPPSPPYTGFVPPAGTDDAGYDEWVSDPASPVPFTREITLGMTRPYMTEDQRFAARRPDVVTYRSEVLAEDVTVAGPMVAELWVSTSGTASDWIVKVIDEFPQDAEDTPAAEDRDGFRTGGYQMLVRGDVIRGRYRNSPGEPEPFEPGVPTRVELPLLDVLHTFRAGHRIMVQVQSTWFPLVDLNPHTYVENVYDLDRTAPFVPATQRVHRTAEHPSRVRVRLLPQNP
ncbi:MAG: CocE/NonD family hydrolase [Candidatus Longimicrobiales bacterium M2_2A_002]